MDFTDFYIKYIHVPKEKIVIEASFNLGEDDILNAMLVGKIYLQGHYYKIPRDKFIWMLKHREYGETFLELERINYEDNQTLIVTGKQIFPTNIA